MKKRIKYFIYILYISNFFTINNIFSMNKDMEKSLQKMVSYCQNNDSKYAEVKNKDFCGKLMFMNTNEIGVDGVLSKLNKVIAANQLILKKNKIENPQNLLDLCDIEESIDESKNWEKVEKYLTETKTIKHSFFTTIDKNGRTAFSLLCQENQTELINLLFEKIDKQILDDNKVNKKTKEAEIRKIKKELVNNIDKFGYTPLIFACLHNNWELVKLILPFCNKETIISIAQDIDCNCLILAIEYNAPFQIIDQIAKFQESTTFKDKSNKTPIFFSCKNNNPKVTKLLLDNGASELIPTKTLTNKYLYNLKFDNPKLYNARIETSPILICINNIQLPENAQLPKDLESGDPKLQNLKLLVDKFPKNQINLELNDKKDTALSLSIKTNYLHAVTQFISYGANIKKQDLSHSRDQKIKTLVKSAFDLDKKDKLEEKINFLKELEAKDPETSKPLIKRANINCSICQDSITLLQPKFTKILTCFHILHKDCFNLLLKKNEDNKKNESLCPICRKPIKNKKKH